MFLPMQQNKTNMFKALYIPGRAAFTGKSQFKYIPTELHAWTFLDLKCSSQATDKIYA